MKGHRSRPQGKDKKGAILIHVAIAIFVLTAGSAFVLDYGLMWLSRGEAQNAADAGAMAGAVARAFDETVNPPSAGGAAYQSALTTAQANAVFGATPGVTVSWNCPGFAGGGTNCVTVNVFRDGTNGSGFLPTFFAPLLGVTTQGVRATATAWAVRANATDCMRPFSVADKWLEQVNPPDHYDHWVTAKGNVTELNPHDMYVPPSPSDPGTGFRVPADQGTQLILKGGNNPNSSTDPITPGWFLPVRLPAPGGGFRNGADAFRDAIGTCIGIPVTIGDYLPTENGVMNGPTIQGTGDLTSQDPSATWDATTKSVDNSCAPACAPFSPRIVPISVFDMEDFQHRRATNDWSVCPGGGRCVKVVNILGFFVGGMAGNDVVGYLMTYPGRFVVGSPNVGGGASFLWVVQLIR